MMDKISNTINFQFVIGGNSYSMFDTETINVDGDISDKIDIKKQCDSETKTYYKGDTVEYTIIIEIGDITKPTIQIMSDILPDELEFVNGSLTIDSEIFSDDISKIVLDFEPNSTHEIKYKCIIS